MGKRKELKAWLQEWKKQTRYAFYDLPMALDNQFLCVSKIIYYLYIITIQNIQDKIEAVAYKISEYTKTRY